MNRYLIPYAIIAFLLLVQAPGCENSVVIDPADPDNIPIDGGDAVDDASNATDGGDASASSLPLCKSFGDCSGYATCQEGFCCNGTMISGKCVCGTGEGCDLLHVCCVPVGSGPNGVAECVEYTFMCEQS